MSSSKVRVYFLSSGRIGVPILDALRLDTELELVGIGSQPDKENHSLQFPKRYSGSERKQLHHTSLKKLLHNVSQVQTFQFRRYHAELEN